MILPGSESNQKITSDEIAELTINCLINSVPSEVPGIAFLSGGQSELEATKNLNTINKHNKSKFIMTYSYGRALQQSALKHWSKDINDIKGTQKICISNNFMQFFKPQMFMYEKCYARLSIYQLRGIAFVTQKT